MGSGAWRLNGAARCYSGEISNRKNLSEDFIEYAEPILKVRTASIARKKLQTATKSRRMYESEYYEVTEIWPHFEFLDVRRGWRVSWVGLRDPVWLVVGTAVTFCGTGILGYVTLNMTPIDVGLYEGLDYAASSAEYWL